MTTPQIYALFAMLTTAAFAGIVFYCIGLRTGKAAGYEHGRTTAKEYWKDIVVSIRDDLHSARDLLDIRTRETASLRESMQLIERDLLQRLAAAAPLTEQDQAVLLATADKLMLASSTFAGLGSHDHARFSCHLMAQVLDIADRIKKAQANAQPHPDSELIDWLEQNAGISLDCRTATLYFDCDPAELNPVTNTLREIVRHAMQQAAREDLDDEAQEQAA